MSSPEPDAARRRSRAAAAAARGGAAGRPADRALLKSRWVALLLSLLSRAWARSTTASSPRRSSSSSAFVGSIYLRRPRARAPLRLLHPLRRLLQHDRRLPQRRRSSTRARAASASRRRTTSESPLWGIGARGHRPAAPPEQPGLAAPRRARPATGRSLLIVAGVVLPAGARSSARTPSGDGRVRFRPEGLVLGLALIGLGVLWTLANVGTRRPAGDAARWWPLTLVLWGVLELIAFVARRRRAEVLDEGAKIGLLFLILAFGATVETAWQVRNHIGSGPWAARCWAAASTARPSPSTPSRRTTGRARTRRSRWRTRSARSTSRRRAGRGDGRACARSSSARPRRRRAPSPSASASRPCARATPLRVAHQPRELDASRRRTSRIGFETHLELDGAARARAVKVQNEHGGDGRDRRRRRPTLGSFDDRRVERVAGAAEIDVPPRRRARDRRQGRPHADRRHGDVRSRTWRARATLDVQHGERHAPPRVGGLDRQQRPRRRRPRRACTATSRSTRQHGVGARPRRAGRAVRGTSFDGVTLERVGGEAQGAHGARRRERLTDVTGAVDARGQLRRRGARRASAGR